MTRKRDPTRPPLAGAAAPSRDPAGRIQLAFVYGSVAKGTERAGSDLDLLVVSDSLTYPDVYGALQDAEQVIARTVNPTVMTPAEWQKKRSASDSFARRIASQPKLLRLIRGAPRLYSGTGWLLGHWKDYDRD